MTKIQNLNKKILKNYDNFHDSQVVFIHRDPLDQNFSDILVY